MYSFPNPTTCFYLTKCSASLPQPRRLCFHIRLFVGLSAGYTKTTESISIKIGWWKGLRTKQSPWTCMHIQTDKGWIQKCFLTFFNIAWLGIFRSWWKDKGILMWLLSMSEYKGGLGHLKAISGLYFLAFVLFSLWSKLFPFPPATYKSSHTLIFGVNLTAI